MTGPSNSGIFQHIGGNVLDAMADDSDNDASNTDDQFSKMLVGSRNNKNSSNRP